MKYWGKAVSLGIAVSLVLILISCSLFEHDEPTTPVGVPGNAVDIANCYASDGDPSGYGVYVGSGFFVVNVPKSGDYVIQYTVKGSSEVFTLVIKVKKATMVYLGLGEKVELEDAGVVETEVTVADSEATSVGSMLVYTSPSWPAHMRKALSEVTKIPPGHINLLVDTSSEIVVIIVVKGGKAQSGTSGGVTVVIIPATVASPPVTSTAVL